MRIAGHIVTKPTNEFEFIELDFNKVLYIRIDINDTVTYHSSTQTFFESKSLFEFSLFEHSLEKMDIYVLKVVGMLILKW